jgi:beta-phosphoglucomutase-like phosphatase (HAD superfamily)
VCVGRGLAAKPAPDTYRAACAALAVEPRAAIALEDSPHGVAAAKAAGLWCVAVPHAITELLDLSEADLVVRSLADVSLRDVLRTRRDVSR